METAPLKPFATWARTELIREVSARISVVLASQELRQEQPKAVAALEKAVNAASGDKGLDAVADKVAYTWFNRIVALRFMDANGYTGIGVVSPEHGREGGQPEILADANRGNIDPGIVHPAIATTVTSLLNGRRRSPDPLGEAYTLLLAEYCRHWNRSMPFMFESEGDYTELLIPANLLADDSVLARAATVLTKKVCQDVEVIGWLYQFYISERKDEVFAGFKKNKKAGAAEIPAATQLFTPHWIVRYLVENSLGRLWLLNRPTSRLADQMDYYIATVDAETDYLKVSSPEELKVIDPACGSGHMLTYAFDLLHAIYEEEGYAPSDIPALILANNLYGTEIDPRAGTLAAFALTMKARARQRTFFNKKVEPSICVLEPISFTPSELETLVTPGGDRQSEEAFWNQFGHADTRGALIRPDATLLAFLRQRLESISKSDGDLFASSTVARGQRVLDQAGVLCRSYAVVVANPPYMGAKNFNSDLATWTKRVYRETKADLFAMFIERSLAMLAPLGYAATVTMDSWMFQGTYESLRGSLVAANRIVSLVHMPYDGRGRTPMGINFGITASVVMKHRDLTSPGAYMTVRHFEIDADGVPFEFPVQNEFANFVAGADLTKIPGAPVAFWASPAELRAFEENPLLKTVASLRHGMSTSDNDRFLRQWYEVSRSNFETAATSAREAIDGDATWFPFCKGGDLRRWYGNLDYVVNWHNDGEEIKAEADRKYPYLKGKLGFVIGAEERYFQPAVTWSSTTSSDASFRFLPAGSIISNRGQTMYPLTPSVSEVYLLGAMNSSVSARFLSFLSPTLGYELGYVANTPIVLGHKQELIEEVVIRLVSIAKTDWDSFEVSWDYARHPLLAASREGNLRDLTQQVVFEWQELVAEMFSLERELDRHFRDGFDLPQDGNPGSLESVTLKRNARAKVKGNAHEQEQIAKKDMVVELISYFVGVAFGRYSLDEPGLILANQGDTLQDYLAKVPSPTFRPDKDNVIPIVDGDWFEDDIVARFRQFMRVAFGEQHFEENLRFVTESLGVKDLRDYFAKSFYKDHVQRYKKRPIYWLFSSPKGSFNALIYMHRYTPSTVSTVLNEYLREFKAKLEASRQHHERLAAGGGTPREKSAAQKEVDRLRKVLLELDEYEHDVLYPLATQQVHIDLDDGVKANYPKLGAALKKIPGLEASDE